MPKKLSNLSQPKSTPSYVNIRHSEKLKVCKKSDEGTYCKSAEEQCRPAAFCNYNTYLVYPPS